MDKPPRTTTGDFNGSPVITIYTGHVYMGKEESVTLGLRKVKAMLRCIDALRGFVEKQENLGRVRYK